MKLTHRLTTITLTLLALGLGLSSGPIPAQAAAKTFLVDDDKAQCPAAGYTTIQTAIDAVTLPGSKITVCAGTYAEEISISGKTKLRLVGKPGAVITVPVTPDYNGTLVSVYNSTNVVIQGFTIDGQNQVGTLNGDIAVRFYQASGTVQKNTIQNWATPGAAAYANGMYAIDLIGTAGEPIKVVKNTISGFQDHGIAATGNLKLTVTGNTITGTSVSPNTPYAVYLTADSNGSPRGVVKGNKLNSDAFPAGNPGTAIYVSEASPLVISGNVIRQWNLGVNVLAFCGAAPTVNNNKIKGNKMVDVAFGIALQSTPFYSCDSHMDNTIVTGNRIVNTIQPGTDGIQLVVSWNGALNAYGLNEKIKGNVVTNFATPYAFSQSGPQVFVSGVFGPNK